VSYLRQTRRAADGNRFRPLVDGEIAYKALHDGRQVSGLEYEPNNEFIIETVGTSDERHFADLGIEYYKYIA